MRAEALLLKSLQRSLFTDHRYPQWQDHRSSNIGVPLASSSQCSEGSLIGTRLTFLGYQRKASG